MTHTVCRFDKDETLKGRVNTWRHLKDMKVNMATVDYIITDESSVSLSPIVYELRFQHT